MESKRRNPQRGVETRSQTRKGERSEDPLWASPEEMDEDWSAPDDIGVWERDRKKKV